jgi:type IV pilus assembly protein PilM
MGAGFHFKRTRRLLGLDFGTSSFKVVELTQTGGEITLSGFDSAPVGEDPAAALAELLQRGDYSTKNVALAVGGRSVCVRYAHFPKMPPEELLEAVRLESDRLLPFEDTAVTLDCQELTPSGAETDEEAMPVLVAACRTDFVEERVDAVLSAGFTPTVVDVDLFGLVNAWALEACPERAQVVALVDVGSSRTGVVLVEDGTPRFNREFGQGSIDVAGESAIAMPASFAETSELDALAREIALSVEYAEHNEGLEVEEIHLTGEGALIDGLTTRLAEEARRPVELWNPMAQVVRDADKVSLHDLGERGPGFTVALGLAARVLSA